MYDLPLWNLIQPHASPALQVNNVGNCRAEAWDVKQLFSVSSENLFFFPCWVMILISIAHLRFRQNLVLEMICLPMNPEALVRTSRHLHGLPEILLFMSSCLFSTKECRCRSRFPDLSNFSDLYHVRVCANSVGVANLFW